MHVSNNHLVSVIMIFLFLVFGVYAEVNINTHIYTNMYVYKIYYRSRSLTYLVSTLLDKNLFLFRWKFCFLSWIHLQYPTV
jgi:hypothetical protein